MFFLKIIHNIETKEAKSKHIPMYAVLYGNWQRGSESRSICNI